MHITKIEFTIAAGKFDGEDINWKYIDSTTDCAEALLKYNSCKGYSVVEFHVESTWDDRTVTRASVFGGPEERLLADGTWQRLV